MVSDKVRVSFKLIRSDIVLIITALLMITGLNILYFKNSILFEENNMVSNYQAIVLLIAGVMALINSGRREWKAYKKLYIFLGCSFLFIMFEEIDWGQHILKFESPDIFLKAAFQEEFSIHHLGMGMVEIPVHIALLLVSGIALVNWRDYEKLPFIRKLPKLTQAKYVFFILIALYYLAAVIILFGIPMMKHARTMFSMQENLHIVYSIRYPEIMEAVEYTMALILISIRPGKL